MSEFLTLKSNHGKTIAMTTIFVIVLSLIVFISTAVPLAVNTSKQVNNKKVQSASGYAWAAFAFELISLILIGIVVMLYYNCVENEGPNSQRQQLWHNRSKAITSVMDIGVIDKTNSHQPSSISNPVLDPLTTSAGAMNLITQSTQISPATSLTSSTNPAPPSKASDILNTFFNTETHTNQSSNAVSDII